MLRAAASAVVRRAVAARAAPAAAAMTMPLRRVVAPVVVPIVQRAAFHRTAVLHAVKPFLLADIGEGIVEVEMVKWYIKEGDTIHEFDKLCEVHSDKATVDVTSPWAGVVKKIHYKVGDMARTGKPLIDIDVAGSAPAAPAPASTAGPAPTTPAATATAVPQEPGSQAAPSQQHATFATPAVRHLAKQHNIDLRMVKGSGKGGRVMKEDILRHIGELPPVEPVVAPTSPPPSPAAKPAAPSVMVVREDRREAVRGFKKIMVKTMNESWRRIPHFGYKDEIVMNEMTHVRKAVKEIAAQEGVKLSYMPLLIKAASIALRTYPLLNSSLTEDESEIIYKASHNIGVAMDTPNGLIVPNIKDVQDRSIMEIARELNRLQQLGSKGQLGPADLSGGTFTFSNIGTIGGTYMNPVIVSPEVCIGAIGKIDTVPRYDKNGDVKPVQIMAVSWSADHRIIDGATMARFSTLWKSYVENPAQLLLFMK